MQRKSLYQYGVFALPLSFVGLPLYLYIPDLYATQFGLSLTTIGLLLLAIRFIDALQDPIIGTLTATLPNNKSKLRNTLLCSVAVLIIGMFLLLEPMANISVALWFAVSMVICTTAFSVLSILYQSVGAIWKKDYFERTTITTAREAFGLLGVMLAAILPSVLMQYYPAKQAFEIFFFVFTALIVFASCIWLAWLGKTKFEDSGSQYSFSFFSILKSAQTRPFFVVWFASQLASAIPVILVIFFIRDRLQLENLTGLFLLTYFFSGIVGMLIWQKAQAKFSKQQLWQAAMALAVASFLWAFFLGVGDAIGFTLVCVFSGIALGGELAIPPSILADKISGAKASADSTKFFAISTFLSKFALALASGLVLPLLASNGYSPVTKNSDSALLALAFFYALLPCIIKASAFLYLTRLKLEDKNYDNRNKN